MMPFGQTKRRNDGCQSGFCQSGTQARMPDAPSTITWRTSSIVSPTSPMWRPLLDRARLLIHCAPVRVLPKPRPAINSQTRQSPAGGNCLSRAHNGQSCIKNSICVAVSPAIRSRRVSGSIRANKPRHFCLKLVAQSLNIFFTITRCCLAQPAIKLGAPCL